MACFPGEYVEYPIKPKYPRTEETKTIFPLVRVRIIRLEAAWWFRRIRPSLTQAEYDHEPWRTKQQANMSLPCPFACFLRSVR